LYKPDRALTVIGDQGHPLLTPSGSPNGNADPD
jgi:hypothetical protein